MNGHKLKQLLLLNMCLAASTAAFAADATTTTSSSSTSSSTSSTTTSAAPNGTTSATTSTATTAGGTAATVEALDPAQLRVRFEVLAGSTENAQALVTGLRAGSAITLTAEGDPSSSGSISFTPPTKPMGYGEISRALSLAEAQLASQGITDPTPEQLRVALMGGSFTEGTQTIATTGVLQLRSRGMGWGQIAHALNVSASARIGAGASMPTAAGTHGIRSGTSGAAGSGRLDRVRGTESSITTASGTVIGTRGNASSVSAQGRHTTLSSGALTGSAARSSMAFGAGHAFEHGVVSGGMSPGGSAGHGLGLGR